MFFLKITKQLIVILLMLSIVSTHIVHGENNTSEINVIGKSLVSSETTDIFDMDDNLVGHLQPNEQLIVQQLVEDRVYFQWGTSLAYVMTGQVRIVESKLEPLQYSHSPVSITSTESIPVYKDEGLTQLLLTLHPNTDYLIESYSETLYKVIVGNCIGYIDIAILKDVLSDEKVLPDPNEIIPSEEIIESPIEEHTDDSATAIEEKEDVTFSTPVLTSLARVSSLNVPLAFTAADKYFEPTERVTVYDNSTGKLVFVGYLEMGQTYPRVSDYGDWHKIKYGNGDGFVWKASTKPASGNIIKNLDTGSKPNGITIKANSILSVYDNSSGALVPFASLNKDISYPIVGVMGEWYRISIAGRIGYIYAPATTRDFQPADKYFVPNERVTVYDNSTGKLVFVGYLEKGQAYPRVSDYGDWHKIKYGNGDGFVWKASTTPSNGSTIKNLDTGSKPNGITIKANSILSVYDNSSGALVPFASLNKDISYPIVGVTGEWYRISIAGRIGHIYAPATTRVFTAADKYFEPTERLTVYDNSSGSLVFVGYLEKGQSYPRVGDYGDWHQIKYGRGSGFVWKASTIPSTGSSIKNLDKGSINSRTSFKATSILSVYDNTSGSLVPFGSLNKDVLYPIIRQEGEWYVISLAGRIGYIYEPATVSGVKGRTIVIDAGHGDGDSGAVGTTYKTYEKTINLSTALYLQSYLKSAGANVIMTRSTDKFLTLPERAAISNNTNADAFISIHYNSYTSTTRGIETFYYSAAKDKKLADYVHAELISKTGFKNRSVKFGNYHVLRENKIPSILVELGFLSNPQEENIIRTADYHKKAANAIYLGLEDYFYLGY